MATRYIATKLILEGEKEYQSAIRSINAEQRAFNSELKLLESKFKGAANSMEALAAKGEAYQRILNSQNKKLETVSEHLEKAKKAYDEFAQAGSKTEAELSKNETALNALDESTRKSGEEWAKYAKQIEQSQGKLKSLQNSSEDTSAEQQKLADKIAKAQAAMKKLEESTDGAAKTAGELVQENARLNAEWEKAQSKTQGAADKVNQLQNEYNKAKIAVNEADAALKQNAKYLDEAKESADGTAKSIDEFGNEVDNSVDSLDALASALAAAGVIGGLKKIAEALKEAIDASIEFESAITGVYKTVEGTDEQLQAISDGIKQLSTVIPASTTELAAVAEAAGQLGIATDDILSFTEVMTNLGVTTNLSAEEAATALARFANIAGTSSADYERLGSTIVALGNNFATTESEIVQMATRLASAGTLAGLTESQIMALAAAMSSVGIQAEAGGTAMTQTMTAIEKAVAKGGKDLEQFAKIAGMSSSEFSKAWKDDAMTAIQAFIAGLGGLEAQGESATLVLDDMGLSGIRQSNMLKSLSLASEELAKAVDLSSLAWVENSALADEAALRYGTTESKIQLFRNSVDLLKVSIGDALTPALGELAETGADVNQWAAEFVEENPDVVQGITAIVVAFGTFAGAVVTITAAAKALEALKLALALMVSPATLAASAIVSIGAAITMLALTASENDNKFQAHAKRIEETAEKYEDLKKKIAEQGEETQELAAKLNLLVDSSDDSEASIQAIADATQQLITLVPELSGYIDESTGMLRGNWEVLVDLNEQTQLYAVALDEQAEAEAELNRLKKERAEAEKELAELEAGRSQSEIINSEDRQRYIDLQLEIERYNELIGAQQEALDNATDSVNSFNTAIDEQGELFGKLTTQEIISEMMALEEEYNAAYDAAYKSIDGQINLFEKMAVGTGENINDMIAALESQVAYMDTYADNMAKAVALGIDEGLLAKLSDGSVQSAAYLQAIVDGGAEKVSELNQKFAQVEDGKKAFAEQTALLVTDFDTKMADLEKRLDEAVEEMNQSPEAAKAGRDTMQGYLNGIDEKTGPLYTKMQAVAKQAIASFRAGLETASPSKATRRAAHDTAEGFIIGIDDKQREINDVMKRAAELAVESFGEGFEETAELAKKAMEEYQSYVDGLADSMKSTLDGIQGKIEAVTREQEAMAKKLADYGELINKVSISWSDGSKSEYSELSNIQSQIDILEQYGETLDALRERGISDSLMSEITAMSVDEALEYGRLLLQQSDEQWKEYNAKWEEKQKLAKEIAEKFYKDELDTLEGEYAQELQESLTTLHDIAYSSGEDTVRGLIAGMQAQEAALRAQAERIAAIAASAARASIDGSHAGGLPFVPFDGYRAELHFGERVLTAEEAQEYARRSIPSVLEPPKPMDSNNEQTAAIVNALSTLTAGASEGAAGDLTVVINTDGVEFFRATLPAFRQVQSENPIEVNDF